VPIIPVFLRLRQEDHEFGARPGIYSKSLSGSKEGREEGKRKKERNP
jgi:hypothetical protein